MEQFRGTGREPRGGSVIDMCITMSYPRTAWVQDTPPIRHRSWAASCTHRCTGTRHNLSSIASTVEAGLAIRAVALHRTMSVQAGWRWMSAMALLERRARVEIKRIPVRLLVEVLDLLDRYAKYLNRDRGAGRGSVVRCSVERRVLPGRRDYACRCSTTQSMRRRRRRGAESVSPLMRRDGRRRLRTGPWVARKSAQSLARARALPRACDEQSRRFACRVFDMPTCWNKWEIALFRTITGGGERLPVHLPTCSCGAVATRPRDRRGPKKSCPVLLSFPDEAHDALGAGRESACRMETQDQIPKP